MNTKDFAYHTAAFVGYLRAMAKSEEGQAKAALAELRRGLGDLPNISPFMYRHVESRLPEGLHPSQRQSYYLIAALFADYHTGQMRLPEKVPGNMGDHFAAARDTRNPTKDEAVERRFNALLTAHPDDLYYELRQAVSFLRARGDNGIPINWVQLMRDVARWASDDGRPYVQERWARAFWRRRQRGTPATTTPITFEPAPNERSL